MLEKMQKDYVEMVEQRDKLNKKISILKRKIDKEIKKQNEISIYDLVYIMAENSTVKDISVIENEIKNIIGYNNIKKVEHLGIKKLAYEIKGNKQGYYVVYKFKSALHNIKEIERGLRTAEKVIKFITLKGDEEE